MTALDRIGKRVMRYLYRRNSRNWRWESPARTWCSAFPWSWRRDQRRAKRIASDWWQFAKALRRAVRS